MKTPMLALALVLYAALMTVAASAQMVPQPDVMQGDGRTSAFYTWEKAIPRKPGTFLRAETLPAILGLANAGRQERILYSSTDGIDGTSPIVVSGAIFEPKGTPPKGGWPVIAWAHGTLGVADICAPSWAVRSYRDIAYLDTDVRGTVATGVPYFGPNVQSAGASDPTAVDPGIAYIFYLVLMAQQTDPSLDAASLFTPAAMPLFEVSRSACIDSMEANVELARLTDAASLKPALSAILAKHLKQFEFPTLALRQPVFIGTGMKDHDVRPAVQEQLVRDSCAAGTIVEAHRYAGLTHSETVNASLKDSLPFVRKVFAGEKPVPICSPNPE